MARAPTAPGKTRLAPHLSDERLRSLRTALLVDVLRVAEALDGIERYLFFTPDEAAPEMAALAGGAFTLGPQRGADLGLRMRSAFEELLIERGYQSAILIGSDIPMLTVAHLEAARDRLRAADDLVLGPADDGGYYLIGLRTSESRLFEAIEWGSSRVFSDTVQIAERLGLTPQIVQSAYDIDTMKDLRRLERDLTTAPLDVAPHTRDWLRQAERDGIERLKKSPSS